MCSSHEDHLWYWASGRNVYITHVIFLLFLNIPIFQRVLDKSLLSVSYMLCLKCGIFLYSWQHINDIRNCSMFTYCEIVTLLDYMLFAVFSFTKSLNFSMTYFAKNIIHMNYGKLCHYICCIINSFCHLPLMNFFAFLLSTLKYVKGIFLIWFEHFIMQIRVFIYIKGLDSRQCLYKLSP